MKKGTVPILSVIIPTHRRRDLLRQTLECLGKQTFKDFEVIVISDGPDEKTAEMIQSLSWPFPFQHFAIPKSQQGVARNRAAEQARGKYCLLIGDDIFLAKDACEAHVKAHEKFQIPDARFQINLKSQISNLKSAVAVLGFTTWDPTLPVTPAMRWMERSGVQFGYPEISAYAQNVIPTSEQHWFTYTSNLSLPTFLLRHHPFREGLSLYGWEDIEWGRRLAEAGVRLYYEPAAKGYHHHPLTDDDVWERSERLGASAMEMERLVPGFSICPRGWKRAAYGVCSLLPTYRGKHCRAFLRGMRSSPSPPHSPAPDG